MVSKPIQEYPVNGLMPKQDTQAETFIKKYPNYDGRGTVIAIMDTGNSMLYVYSIIHSFVFLFI
jgi:tripeptidyl-peptidase-2